MDVEWECDGNIPQSPRRHTSALESVSPTAQGVTAPPPEEEGLLGRAPGYVETGPGYVVKGPEYVVKGLRGAAPENRQKMTVRTASSSAPPCLSGKCKPDDNTASDPALIIRPIITGGGICRGSRRGSRRVRPAVDEAIIRLLYSGASEYDRGIRALLQPDGEEDNLVSTVLC
ncbi:unnamed protein product [Arctogadus glacialis]